MRLRPETTSALQAPPSHATAEDGHPISARMAKTHWFLISLRFPRIPLTSSLPIPKSSVSAMRFVTYNLRYDAKPDNITVQQSLDSLGTADPLKPPTYLALTGEQPWSLRRLRVADILLKADIVLAGAALHHS